MFHCSFIGAFFPKGVINTPLWKIKCTQVDKNYSLEYRLADSWPKLDWRTSVKCRRSSAYICLQENQTGVTHAISPAISLKLSPMIKLGHYVEVVWVPIQSRGIRAFTSNFRDKTPKLALQLHLQQRFLTLILFHQRTLRNERSNDGAQCGTFEN